ncbi:MAG: BadF/BadG/BcrA/BcrD ATPase family protein, partial [Dehalococcoidia bacterium]
GSFLDHQAARLGITIEELSRKALESKSPVNIAGRCTVFAESDMVHKQQTGHSPRDIIYGLCRALVRNYLGDVASGKDIQPPVLFQGGVAFNQGIIKALKKELGVDIIVPPHHEVMGAIGAACLAREHMETGGETSRFKGFEIGDIEYRMSSFECNACPIACEINRIAVGDRDVACWGGQCDMWDEKYIGHGVNY